MMPVERFNEKKKKKLSNVTNTNQIQCFQQIQIDNSYNVLTSKVKLLFRKYIEMSLSTLSQNFLGLHIIILWIIHPL